MSRKTVHVTSSMTGQWVVRRSGSDKASKAFSTQREAVDFARTAAERASKKEDVDLIVHGRDGRIRQKDSYGSDPNPPRDKKH